VFSQGKFTDTEVKMRRFASITKSRAFRLIAGTAGIAIIGYVDRRLSEAIPLALLYLAPVVLISTALRRWQIPVLGALCAVVVEFADGFPWTVREGIARDALYFLAYTTAGLYVSEVLSRRATEQSHLDTLEAEIEARRGAEEQLRLVVANSSIAIITSDETGTILQANDAAERMFSGDAPAGGVRLEGSSLSVFMPSLARVQIQRQGWERLKTMLQCQGLRATQDPFLADVWVSSYKTSRGGRLTAMIIDSSTEVRDREEANLEQVLVGSRLAVGALFHEIRNICAAIAVVQQNLRASFASEDPSEDFEALRQLVTALERMASLELSLVRRRPTKLKLDTFLRELRIILTPSLRETGIELGWHIEPNLPEVWADQQSLLQVFLNLVRNAEKALTPVDNARLEIHAGCVGDLVQVRLCDNGPGVSDPGSLFRPFGGGPSASGLGLYLSRAMMLSFQGSLAYQPSASGATFIVEMIPVEAEV
jgi:two-component system, LuxR family, sensor kinase FixL